MANTVNTIGSILKAENIWTEEALPNNTNKSTSVFKLGKIASNVQLNIVFNDAITVTSAKTGKVEILFDSSSTGSFSTSKIIASYIAADEIAAGTTLRYVSTDADLQYAKVKITTTDDWSAKDMTVYISSIPC
jgi:hypothetical protein